MNPLKFTTMNLSAFFKNEERFEDLDASLNSIFDNGLLVEVNSVLGAMLL